MECDPRTCSHVCVCACTISVHVSVAEAFEDCRGLRGMVAGWRKMYGPFAGWM